MPTPLRYGRNYRANKQMTKVWEQRTVLSPKIQMDLCNATHFKFASANSLSSGETSFILDKEKEWE